MSNAYTLCDAIVNEFVRLGVSTEDCPCSGLVADPANCFDPENPDKVIVKVYDDYAGGFYDGNALLAFLKNEKTVTFETIWELISLFEV